MYSRIREIEDGRGLRLRISVDAHPRGALVVLERVDQAGCPTAILDGVGAELLGGYILSARLALSSGLPDERIPSNFPTELRFVRKPAAIFVGQPGNGARFEIPAPLWDRLYGELCVVVAHSRALARQAPAVLH